ncbi:hypothetical protein ABZ635_19310, partial [Nocardiopsis sp. NPDC007018]|uniref:hypothetical protein n=1 Tax=Nocardiopsis sp. NPDC007018 TaxID=3155721 RepID=UPI0033DCB625
GIYAMVPAVLLSVLCILAFNGLGRVSIHTDRRPTALTSSGATGRSEARGRLESPRRTQDT